MSWWESLQLDDDADDGAVIYFILLGACAAVRARSTVKHTHTNTVNTMIHISRTQQRRNVVAQPSITGVCVCMCSDRVLKPPAPKHTAHTPRHREPRDQFVF